jgi:hypothetical protein
MRAGLDMPARCLRRSIRDLLQRPMAGGVATETLPPRILHKLNQR